MIFKNLEAGRVSENERRCVSGIMKNGTSVCDAGEVNFSCND